MRKWVLPLMIVIFGLLSVLVLMSIDRELAPKQFAFFSVGLAVFFAVSRIPFRVLEKFSFPGYLATCVLLVSTLVLAVGTRGTSRWIVVSEGLVIQPSQLAVPLVGLFAASFASRFPLNKWQNLLKFLAIIFVPAALILVEPDLGTTLVFLTSIGSLIYFAPLTWKHWASLAGLAVFTAIFAWMFVLQPYQKSRIYSYTDASQTQSSSYNARQSLIAVGSGKLWGRGLGYGVQSHLRFLPERQTDFIFASLAEELGFAGSASVVLLYTFLISFLLYISAASQSETAKLYCLVTASLFLLQMTVNVGMNIGILPITGITLPLLSYGGSSVLSLCGMLGIIQSIIREQQPQVKLHIQ
jgi:rod shape determining protein RodA